MGGGAAAVKVLVTVRVPTSAVPSSVTDAGCVLVAEDVPGQPALARSVTPGVHAQV
jgi:hypothetical protein